MFFALGHEQLAWHAGFFQLGLKHLPLLERHNFVVRTVDDQHRRVVRRDVRDGGEVAVKFELLAAIGHTLKAGGLGRPFVKIECRIGLHSAGAKVLEDRGVPFSKMNHVGAREVGNRRLHARRDAVDRLLGIRVGSLGCGGEVERQLPAGRAAGDTQSVAIDAVALGVKTNVPHRLGHVLNDFLQRKPGLAPVHDGEDGVALVQQSAKAGEFRDPRNGAPAGIHAAADGPDHTGPVLFARGEDVHQQTEAVLVTVNDVLLLGVLGRAWVWHSDCGREYKRHENCGG